jgi:copper chaperone CopZ
MSPGSRIAGLTVATLLVAPAQAGGLRELDQTIFGMDCAPCAAGVERGLSRLHGVTSVRVSLNEGKAVVTLAPDSQTTLARIREVIRHNGFTPKDARATLVGHLFRGAGQLWLQTTDERFLLAGGAALVEGQDVSAETSRYVSIAVRIPETLAKPPQLRLIAVEPFD